MVTFCNYFCKSNYFPIPAGIGNGTAADNSKNRFGGTPMQTLWNSRDTLPAYPPLREDLHADAAVVGGGMAGILTAYALHTRGLRVVLLEGSRLASGVTAHTTAKITAQHGRFCERLVHDFGFHLARQYLQANLCAVRQFRALVRQKRIDCGFSDESSFIYAASDGPSLTRELEYVLSLGAPARLVKPEGLPFPVREALCFERQAQLSPLPFLAALLPELTVYEHSPVRDIRGNAVRCDGGTVTAEQIVVATHFPMLERFGLYDLRLRQERSYLLALTGAPPLPGMWLDAGEEGWSLRRSGRYLLLGGGGHRCGENLGDSYDRLRAQAQRLFPAAQEAFAWSSQDCMTLGRAVHRPLFLVRAVPARCHRLRQVGHDRQHGRCHAAHHPSHR